MSTSKIKRWPAIAYEPIEVVKVYDDYGKFMYYKPVNLPSMGVLNAMIPTWEEVKVGPIARKRRRALKKAQRLA